MTILNIISEKKLKEIAKELNLKLNIANETDTVINSFTMSNKEYTLFVTKPWDSEKHIQFSIYLETIRIGGETKQLASKSVTAIANSVRKFIESHKEDIRKNALIKHNNKLYEEATDKSIAQVTKFFKSNDKAISFYKQETYISGLGYSLRCSSDQITLDNLRLQTKDMLKVIRFLNKL